MYILRTILYYELPVICVGGVRALTKLFIRHSLVRKGNFPLQ